MLFLVHFFSCSMNECRGSKRRFSVRNSSEMVIKANVNFQFFELNFATISVFAVIFIYGAGILCLITLICCYLFDSVHGIFIELNRRFFRTFERNWNCLWVVPSFIHSFFCIIFVQVKYLNSSFFCFALQ